MKTCRLSIYYKVRKMYERSVLMDNPMKSNNFLERLKSAEDNLKQLKFPLYGHKLNHFKYKYRALRIKLGNKMYKKCPYCSCNLNEDKFFYTKTGRYSCSNQLCIAKAMYDSKYINKFNK